MNHTEKIEGVTSNDFTKLKEPSPMKEIGVSENNRRPILILVTIFTVSVLILFAIYSSSPDLKPEEKEHLKLPRNIEDARNLGKVLTIYKKDNYFQTLLGFLVTYIFLQSFAIPGSIFLSILSGYLFPWQLAIVAVCFCSATGASICYYFSYLIGRKLVIKYFPERVHSWSKIVEKHRGDMLNYIIFLRITPFLPNWFINIASPVINVSIIPFYLGTFIGVAPPSLLAIQTGTTLYELTTSTATFTWTRVAFLGGLALLSLLPVFFKRRLKERYD